MNFLIFFFCVWDLTHRLLLSFLCVNQDLPFKQLFFLGKLVMKHKWEHTPQWKEAAKFSLSKHQQVQLLEAAQILLDMENSIRHDTSSSSSYPSLSIPPSTPLPMFHSNQTAYSSSVTSPPPPSNYNGTIGLNKPQDNHMDAMMDSMSIVDTMEL